jgi:hypothetical protein
LLRQPEELRAMAQRGRRAAEDLYAVSVMRDRFLELAREMQGGAGDYRAALI